MRILGGGRTILIANFKHDSGRHDSFNCVTSLICSACDSVLFFSICVDYIPTCVCVCVSAILGAVQRVCRFISSMERSKACVSFI